MGLSSYSGLIRHVDLFAGSGMLGVACRIALGEWLRTVCYVEREAYAQANLVARMDDAALDRAPEWDDIRTFGPKQITEATSGVDFITLGFPCQDLSYAGRRAGFEGARSSLFFEALRIASDCAACFGGQWPVLYLENVPGIFSTRTARVFDDCFGEGRVEEVWASVCEEIACSIVGRELATCGYDSIWMPLSAGEVGANHKRKRWWCLAYAKDSIGWGKLIRVREGRGIRGLAGGGDGLDDTSMCGCERIGVPAGSGGEGSGAGDVGGTGYGDGWELPLFAPGRFDPRWGEILERRPDVEPAIRRSVDGLDSRVDRIRLCGGGVVTLAASTAFCTLVDFARGVK